MSIAYPNHISKAEILKRADLVEIVSHHVQLKRNGNRYVGLCPFHQEKTPSFGVTPERQLFHCFGCGKGGNVIDFVMAMENLTFPEALHHLAGKVGIHSEDTRPPACSPASPQIPQEEKPLPRDPLTVEALAEAKGLPVEYLVNPPCSLETRQYRKDKRDAVLIPYFLPNGSLALAHKLRIALEGDRFRWLGKKEDAIGFYGLQHLPRIRQIGACCITEGESDCWALWYHRFPAIGIPSATYTGKLKLEHLAGIDTIYVFKDPDKAGEECIQDLKARLIGWTGTAFLMDLQSEYGWKDPNDLHRKDPQGFNRVIINMMVRAHEAWYERRHERDPAGFEKIIYDIFRRANEAGGTPR